MPDTQATEISRWVGRVAVSKHDRKRDREVRLKLMRWYRNRFWPGDTDGMDEEEPSRRQINFVSMFARTLCANLYAQDPTFAVSSPGNPPPLNSVLSAIANNLPHHVGFRQVAHQCLLDAVVGRFAIAQVGFEAKFGWDSGAVDRDRSAAQAENERFGYEDVRVKPGQDAQIHIKEHQAYKQILAQQAEQSMQQPPLEILGEIDAHIAKHAEADKKMLASPHEYTRERRVWVARVLPVRHKRTAFGWEHRAPFEEARWFWRSGVTPLAEMKRDKSLHTAGLQGTYDLFREGEEFDASGISEDAREALRPDTEMVSWVEIINREKQRRLIYAQGHDQWLFNEQFEYADLFRASGHHKFTLLMDPEFGAGKTPVEDAASGIITVNNGEGKLYDLLDQTAASMIFDESKIDGDSVGKIQRRKMGECIGVRFNGSVDDIRKVMTEYPGARMPQENMASLFSARGSIGSDLGVGIAAMGGDADTNSATAAFANASASSNVIGGLWGTNHEEWTAGIFADALQCVKEYYDTDALRHVVGIDRMEEWEALKQALTKEVEKITVDAGSSLAGRVDKQREDSVGFLEIISKSDLANVRPALEDVCKAFGKDPNRYIISRKDEEARGALQPGPQPDVVGGPDEAIEGPGRPSEGQGEDTASAMRSQASEMSAAASQG